MRPKSIVLLILALGCGLVASIGINQVMANRGTSVVVKSGETLPILVALAKVNMNDPLTPELVKLEAWPKDAIPLGAISKLEDAVDRRARTTLFPGEPILEGKLLAKGETGASPTEHIPAGYRVVAVRVDEVSSPGGLVLPGDRVDLLVHVQKNPTKNIPQTVTKTFLQDVKVFAVNDEIQRAPGGSEEKISAKTISLLVIPAQAELVTLATELGKIRLILRSPNDEDSNQTEGVSAQQLLGGVDATKRDLETQVAAAGQNPLLDILGASDLNQAVESEPKPSAAFTMTLLRGSEVEELEIDEHSKVARPKPDETPAAEETETPLDPAGAPLDPNVPPAEGTEPEIIDEDFSPAT